MSQEVKPIPPGYGTITPSLTLKNTQKALDFYKKAFGAQVIDNMKTPDGKGTMHATMRIGDNIIMMGDEMPGEHCSKSAETMGGSPVSLFVYLPNVDASFQQAVKAGASITMPVADMFWGDRCGGLKDPFGYTWMLATHVRDLTQSEIEQGAQEFFSQAGNE